jgi:hypothetical protein
MSRSRSPHARFAAIKEHLYSNLTDEGVVLNTRNGKYYGLKGAGVAIWSALAQPATIDEIRSMVVDQYEVDETKCELEIGGFLDQLIDEGLVEIVDEAAA